MLIETLIASSVERQSVVQGGKVTREVRFLTAVR